MHFKIEYQNTDGEISDFYQDFIVKTSDKKIYIVETKGREDLDDPKKIERLKQWCQDINAAQKRVKYNWLYVKQEEFEKYKSKSFKELAEGFQNE